VDLELARASDKGWARVAYVGTHTGEYLGFAPSGKKNSYKSVTIKRIVDGKNGSARFLAGWQQ